MMMRFQTRLTLLMGSIALFVLLCVFGVTLLHLKYTTDEVRELGNKYAVDVLKHRGAYSVSVFRGLIEADFHRLARVKLPENESEPFPERVDAIAFSAGTSGNSMQVTAGFKPGKRFTPEELAELNKKFAEAADHIHASHIGDTHFLILDGEIWAHTVRQDGWYLMRMDRTTLREHIYRNTLTHCILLDSAGRELLNTGAELTPELTQLVQISAANENRVYSHETPKQVCAVATLNFPDLGMRNITLIRFYDILTNAPDITERIDGSLAEFYAFFLLLIGFSALALLVPMILFARRIAAPVVKAAEFANTLAEGDFPEPLPQDRSGIVETANLYQSLNWMRMRLSTMIEKLQRSHRREQEERKHVENTSEQKTEFVLAIAHHLGGIVDNIGAEQRELAEKLRHCEDLLLELAELDAVNELQPEKLDTFAFFRNEAAPFADKLEFRYGSSMPQYINADREKMHDLFVRILAPVMHHAVHRLVMPLKTDGESLIFRLDGRGGNRALLDYLRHCEGHALDSAAEDVMLLTLAKQTARLLSGTFEIECRNDGTYQVEVSFLQEDLKV